MKTALRVGQHVEGGDIPKKAAKGDGLRSALAGLVGCAEDCAVSFLLRLLEVPAEVAGGLSGGFWGHGGDLG